MIFDQLIEYNMKNIFLEKSYTNVVEKLVPDLFLENLNWAYLWINNSSKFPQFVFIVLRVEAYQNTLKLSYRPLAFTSYWAFLKNQKSSRTSLPASFSA